MKKYHIEYAEVAEKDIDTLFNVIVYNYIAPITAFRYIEGLINTINGLCMTGYLYAYCISISVEKYGHNQKRIDYKEMAILYSVYEEIVYIHRIIPSSIIGAL